MGNHCVPYTHHVLYHTSLSTVLCIYFVPIFTWYIKKYYFIIVCLFQHLFGMKFGTETFSPKVWIESSFSPFFCIILYKIYSVKDHNKFTTKLVVVLTYLVCYGNEICKVLFWKKKVVKIKKFFLSFEIIAFKHARSYLAMWWIYFLSYLSWKPRFCESNPFIFLFLIIS